MFLPIASFYPLTSVWNTQSGWLPQIKGTETQVLKSEWRARIRTQVFRAQSTVDHQGSPSNFYIKPWYLQMKPARLRQTSHFFLLTSLVPTKAGVARKSQFSFFSLPFPLFLFPCIHALFKHLLSKVMYQALCKGLGRQTKKYCAINRYTNIQCHGELIEGVTHSE